MRYAIRWFKCKLKPPNNYAWGHNKQMEEIQQRKTKLQKDFEDNMRLLQEWEQSITDFDKVV